MAGRGAVLLLAATLVVAATACAPPQITTPTRSITSSAQSGNHSRTAGSSPSASASPSASPSARADACGDPTRSYAPRPRAERLPDAENIPEPDLFRIRKAGYLTVGVSADTQQLGSVVRSTGTFAGFDVDLARAVAEAMFGDPDKIKFVVVDTESRFTALQQRRVDMVARSTTATCQRWGMDLAFSASYLTAYQRLLVRGDPGTRSHVGLADLTGQRVCVPSTTSTLQNLQRYPDLTIVQAETHTRCLYLFREDRVDAITSDDAILAGLAVQDGFAIISEGPYISEEPYALVFNAHDVELVRYVNAVLLQYEKSEGGRPSRWAQSYRQWLEPSLGPRQPPTPRFGRPIPSAVPSATGAGDG